MPSSPIRTQCIGVCVAICAALLPGQARAADFKAQCISAYEQGQKHMQDARLTEARKELLVCMRDVCPELLRNDCDQWLKEVDRSMPSVVVGARAAGADITDVRVTIDGTVVAERLDGKAISLNPGDHVFVFESEAGPAIEQKVLVRVGEKNRPIQVTFGEPRKQGGDKPATTRPVPALAWVFGGLGLVGLGSFTYLGLTGKSEADDYQACKPYCDKSDVDATRTKLLAADVSLGVGVVSLGIATWLVLSRPEKEAPSDSAWKLQAAPLVGGGYAGVSRSF